ncbi:AMP-binding protein [Thalassiella azotivora]
MRQGPGQVTPRDERDLLAAVHDAEAGGPPCVVLDPRTPPGRRRAVEAAAHRAVRAGRLGAGDLVLLTSGSTGAPRGVVRSAASWLASDPHLTALLELTDRDVVHLPGPLASSLYLHGARHAARVGARVLLRDDDATTATVVHTVPGGLADVLDRHRAGGLPALRCVVVAGDRLPGALAEAVVAAGLRLVQYYGAAELSFVACRVGAGRALTPFPQVSVDVRDGVLWARSAYLARGYLDPTDPGPLRTDPAGWASVGDLARTDPDGLVVLGRGDAAVTTAGHTVVVEDVESALRPVAGVDDVAVVGVPHPRHGHVLVAVVAGAADPGALRAAARTLSPPQRPVRYVPVTALPRTGSGKVDRAAARDLATRHLTAAGHLATGHLGTGHRAHPD